MNHFTSYINPSIAADIVVFGYHQGSFSVLLLNRKEEPFKDYWTLPGAFLQIEETLEDTCLRVLETKIGMRKIYLEQLYSFDNPNRDPRGRVISIAHYALISPRKIQLIAEKMAKDVEWFQMGQIPSLGFDHKHILEVALQKLRNKILHHPAGFELLNEQFTMSELHSLYEHILDISIDRRNFRRKILDSKYIVSTGRKREGLKNRPAELYQFNKKIVQNNFHLNIPNYDSISPFAKRWLQGWP